jgi:nucleoside-diphosphate-sugar epimerase
MEKYLVTGGCGFCGVEIVKCLLKKGHKVRVIDVEDLPSELEGLGIDFRKVDIRDKIRVFESCEGIDRIIHTVAKVPISKAGKGFIEVNVNGTRNVLEAALECGIKKVVHISTSAVQLVGWNPVDENDPYNPLGPYAKSKLQGEHVCKEFIKKGLEVDMIRPRTVLGTGRMGIFDMFFDWIYNGSRVYVLGGGHNVIQLLYSEDLAECCYLSSLKKGSYIFNIGSKSYSSLREDMGSLLDYAGTGSKFLSLPVDPVIFTLRGLDLMKLSPLAPWHYLSFHKDFYFNNKRAKEVLGWEPKLGNKEVLKVAYDSYIENRGKNVKIDEKYGTSHRKSLKQGVLGFLKWLP